jgi:hypothetical protein
MQGGQVTTTIPNPDGAGGWFSTKGVAGAQLA